MTTASIHSPRPIWRLVEESMSEAAFLWLRLDAALAAEDHRLRDVERWVQERLLGALDGVRIAGDLALEAVLPEALAEEDVGAVASAAYLLATLGTARAQRTLEEQLRALTPQRVDAFARGLGRAGQSTLLQQLSSRLDAPCAQAALLRALSFCGAAPQLELRPLLEAPEPSLRRAAAAALRDLPSSERDRLIACALGSPDLTLQTEACLASLAAGDAQALAACVERVKRAQPECAPLLPLVAALGTARDHALLLELATASDTRQAALAALGFAGTRAAAEACLAAAPAEPEAAQAFAMITGQDAQTAQAEAWSSESKRFEPDARYLQGQPVTLTTLRAALQDGPTRRRAVFALELSARSGGAFSLQPQALCQVQRQQLRQLEDLQERALNERARTLGARPLATG